MEGILLINKSKGKTSFSIVHELRKITKIRKIGHAGTLDPFATGLMVMLVGRNYTKKADLFLQDDKEYQATFHLGRTSSTFDSEGEMIPGSDRVPDEAFLLETIGKFQGKILQIPPMFSAKKVKGQKLYELARKGIEIERKPSLVTVSITDISYAYPFVHCLVSCSKGTYVRSLANDIGQALGCGAFLSSLKRTRSGRFRLEDSLEQDKMASFPSIEKKFLYESIL